MTVAPLLPHVDDFRHGYRKHLNFTLLFNFHIVVIFISFTVPGRLYSSVSSSFCLRLRHITDLLHVASSSSPSSTTIMTFKFLTLLFLRNVSFQPHSNLYHLLLPFVYYFNIINKAEQQSPDYNLNQIWSYLPNFCSVDVDGRDAANWLVLQQKLLNLKWTEAYLVVLSVIKLKLFMQKCDIFHKFHGNKSHFCINPFVSQL